MIVYLPFPNKTDCVEFWTQPHLLAQSAAISQICMVVHEQGQLYEVMRDHPEVIRWREHLPWLIDYGMAMLERFASEKKSNITALPEFKMLSNGLSSQLELATVDEFSMEPPDVFGPGKPIHVKHLRRLVTEFPQFYCKYFSAVNEEWCDII